MSARFARPWMWFSVYAVVVTSVSAALYIAGSIRFDGQQMSFGRALAWQLAIYGLWALTVPLIAFAGRRWRVKRGRLANPWTASLPAYLVACAAAVPIHSAIYAWITWLAMPAPAAGRAGFEVAAGPLMMARFPINILIFWAIVGVLYAIDHARTLREREQTAAALEAALASAQFHTLRAQLQPHFLFNALQSIAALISLDPGAARTMTGHLATLLRSTLDRDGQQQVTLREELDLLQKYLAIEAVRYSDRLTIAYDIADDAREVLVPDLLLQPLAENAIRHGIEPEPGPGRIRIGARVAGERLRLWIENDGANLPPGWSNDTAGHGLGLTRRRLDLSYGGEANITLTSTSPHRGVRVDIEIPAVRAKQSIEKAPETANVRPSSVLARGETSPVQRSNAAPSPLP